MATTPTRRRAADRPEIDWDAPAQPDHDAELKRANAVAVGVLVVAGIVGVVFMGLIVVGLVTWRVASRAVDEHAEQTCEVPPPRSADVPVGHVEPFTVTATARPVVDFDGRWWIIAGPPLETSLPSGTQIRGAGRLESAERLVFQPDHGAPIRFRPTELAC